MKNTNIEEGMKKKIKGEDTEKVSLFLPLFSTAPTAALLEDKIRKVSR